MILSKRVAIFPPIASNWVFRGKADKIKYLYLFFIPHCIPIRAPMLCPKIVVLLGVAPTLLRIFVKKLSISLKTDFIPPFPKSPISLSFSSPWPRISITNTLYPLEAKNSANSAYLSIGSIIPWNIIILFLYRSLFDSKNK